MRIGVASDDGVAVALHFARCSGFEIFEVLGDKIARIERRQNAGGHHHGQHDCGGHEHHQATSGHQSFVNTLRDCQALICRGMGRRAMTDLAAAGIKPVIAIDDVSVSEAVRLYASGQLKVASDSHCCSHD